MRTALGAAWLGLSGGDGLNLAWGVGGVRERVEPGWLVSLECVRRAWAWFGQSDGIGVQRGGIGVVRKVVRNGPSEWSGKSKNEAW